MKSIIVLLTFMMSFITTAQDLDLIGSWANSIVITGNEKKEELVNPQTFSSALSLNADSTFTLVTTGFEIVMGKFTAGPNFIIFFKLIGFEDYQRFWDIRWQEGNDPFPDTPEIDMMIPTQAMVQNKKKMKPFTSQVYVIFEKIEE